MAARRVVGTPLPDTNLEQNNYVYKLAYIYVLYVRMKALLVKIRYFDTDFVVA